MLYPFDVTRGAMTDRPSMETGTRPATGQFATIHAMRGIAAFWVVLFHIWKSDALTGLDLSRWSNATTYLLEDGRGGVAMFFVISGFVMTHSLWAAKPDLGFLGRFMLRRSIRLDPPYWVSMVVAVAVFGIMAERRGIPFIAPGAGQVVAHMLYIQEFLRVPDIQLVYWTLTYEIQFYLVLVLVLWWQRGFSPTPWLSRALPILMVALAFIAAFATDEWAPHGLFLNFWHAFVAGCLAYAGGYRRHDFAAMLAVVIAIIMLWTAPATGDVFNSPAALTALIILALGRFGGLSRGLYLVPLQFLGTISYSLYLFHIPTIIVAMSIGTRLFERSPTGAILMFLWNAAACIAAAALFWWLIERPTHRLAKSVQIRASQNK